MGKRKGRVMLRCKGLGGEGKGIGDVEGSSKGTRDGKRILWWKIEKGNSRSQTKYKWKRKGDKAICWRNRRKESLEEEKKGKKKGWWKGGREGNGGRKGGSLRWTARGCHQWLSHYHMKGPFLIGLVSVLFPPYGREDPPRSSRSMRTWGLDVRFGKEARVTNHSSLKTVGRRGVVLVFAFVMPRVVLFWFGVGFGFHYIVVLGNCFYSFIMLIAIACGCL